MKKNSIIATLITVICLGVMTGITGCEKTQDKNKDGQIELETENKKPKPNLWAKHKPIMMNYEEIPVNAIEKKDDPYKNTVDFESTQNINPDAYAWIKIPNTVINYPILQSTTKPDDYYLMRTINLRAGYPGSIYTEKCNSQDFMDPVTVIYGHDMRNGSMFAALHKYRSAKFFAENPYFYIYLPDKTLKYHIFSAVAFNDNHIMKSYDFKNEEELMRFYSDLMRCKTGNTDDSVVVKKRSRIVTMSTCIGPRPDQRWVVSGTLISIEKKAEDD